MVWSVIDGVYFKVAETSSVVRADAWTRYLSLRKEAHFLTYPSYIG